MYDFKNGEGPVPAKRHVNLDNSVGGWVANTATVTSTAHVSYDAVVFGNAHIFGKAKVYGNTQVYGEALVSGNAKISYNARVSGNAVVSYNALIRSTGDIAHGTLAGYDWTLYRTEKGWMLQYGCETHLVTAWAELHDELSRRYTGTTVHGEWTRMLCDMAKRF